MPEIKGHQTKIYRNGDYRFIGKLQNIGIRPRDDERVDVDGKPNVPEFQIYSNYLLINVGYNISESPLLQLIHSGIIIPDGIESIKGTDFMKYKFVRHLIDSRKYTADSEGYYGPDLDNHSKNENDCLKMGEALSLFMVTRSSDSFFSHLAQISTEPELCERTSSQLMGQSTWHNRNILKSLNSIKKNTKIDVSIDNTANPEPGEAYAIIREKSVMHRSPYHIAFVIYREDGVNITLEAEDGAGKSYLPTFAFYDVNEDGNTFHRYWSGEQDNAPDILYGNGKTVVLKKCVDISIKRGRDSRAMRESLPYSTLPLTSSSLSKKDNKRKTSLSSSSLTSSSLSKKVNKRKRPKRGGTSKNQNVIKNRTTKYR